MHFCIQKYPILLQGIHLFIEPHLAELSSVEDSVSCGNEPSWFPSGQSSPFPKYHIRESVLY